MLIKVNDHTISLEFHYYQEVTMKNGYFGTALTENSLHELVKSILSCKIQELIGNFKNTALKFLPDIILDKTFVDFFPF